MRNAIVALVLLLLLALAALGGGWKWTHGQGSTGKPVTVADGSGALPDGWTWDT
jgi:hypothetical protein